MDLRLMDASDLDGAVRVWQTANIARGKRPSPERVARDGDGAVSPETLHISMVFIDPVSQRQGGGSRLMRYALDRAHASSV